MRIRTLLTPLLAAPLLAGAALTGCTDLDVTNPNQPSTQTFWRTAEDADRGITAAYNALQLLGVFSRWHIFANDIRSDIGTAQTSPWGDLANFHRFQLADYNFEVNRHLWIHNYELVARANQVIANVPGIDMDETVRARRVAEAKFLRALAYYNLVILYDNIPLILAPPRPNERPGNSTPAEVFAQIESDLVDAAPALQNADEQPTSERGHATRGAALAMLGRVRLQMAGMLNQQAKWGEAAQALGQVITSGDYQLLGDYADNFRLTRDGNNPESVFEVENEDLFPIGVTGMSFPKMIGPCYRPGPPLPEFNPTYCDGRPTRWYFDEFSRSRTTTGGVDPRMQATLLWNDPARAGERVFGRARGDFFVDNPQSPAREDTMIFFRKYGEWETSTDQRWDNPVNYKVIRYADVLLMQAEALNQSGQTPQAFQYVNQVRARAQKPPLIGLSATQLRDSILHERMFELGLEMSRWADLRRYNLLGPALAAHDPDFTNFVPGKSERLPIPTTELNLNPNMKQNPGW